MVMRKAPTVLVTGAGGFVGRHLVKYLVKPQRTDADEFVIADLRNHTECMKVPPEGLIPAYRRIEECVSGQLRGPAELAAG